MRVFEGKHVLVFERDGREYVERKKAKEAVAVIALRESEAVLVDLKLWSGLHFLETSA